MRLRRLALALALLSLALALPPRAARAAPPPRFALELVATVPWGPDTFDDPAAVPPRGRGAPPRARRAPQLLLGADGGLWLFDGRRLLRQEHGRFRRFPLEAADIWSVTRIVPAGDGVIALGIREHETVLARLGARGERRWRRTAPLRFEQPVLARLEGSLDLRGDRARGAVYVISLGPPWVMGRVDLTDGAIGAPVPLPDAAQTLGGPFVDRDTLYVARRAPRPAEDAPPAYDWVARDLRTGRERVTRLAPAPVPGPLYDAAYGGGLSQSFASPHGPLPDGGGVFGLDDLAWIGADGRARGQITLRHGLVPAAPGVAIAVPESHGLRVTVWHGARQLLSFLAPTRGESPAHARLVAGGSRGYRVYSPAHRACVPRSRGLADALLSFDARGGGEGGHTTVPCDEQRRAETFLAVESRIAEAQAFVAPDGAVLLAGAGPEGVYLVRLRPIAGRP